MPGWPLCRPKFREFDRCRCGLGESTIIIKVKGQPEKARVDPYNKLIDRIPDDNSIDMEIG